MCFLQDQLEKMNLRRFVSFHYRLKHVGEGESFVDVLDLRNKIKRQILLATTRALRDQDYSLIQYCSHLVPEMVI